MSGEGARPQLLLLPLTLCNVLVGNDLGIIAPSFKIITIASVSLKPVHILLIMIAVHYFTVEAHI